MQTEQWEWQAKYDKVFGNHLTFFPKDPFYRPQHSWLTLTKIINKTQNVVEKKIKINEKKLKKNDDN